MSTRSWFADGPTSIGGRARARRWKVFQATFPDIESLRVLDLGGTAYSWLDAPVRPKSVTLLNLVDSELTVRHENETFPDWLTLVAGDACDPPAVIRESTYDLVYSNSLLEHVGGPARRQQFADFVRSAAPKRWIQTPYRYFPIEPHWIFPGFQFLPLAVRAAVSSRWPLMHTRAERGRAAVDMAVNVELLSLTELRWLFPESEVRKERFAGLTKSLIVVAT